MDESKQREVQSFCDNEAREKKEGMRGKLAVLCGGMMVAALLAVPASAHADTDHGCEYMKDVGNDFNNPIGFAYAVGGALEFYGAPGQDLLCNIGVPIDGVFEITDLNSNNGCVGVDSVTNEIVVETSAACAVYGGDGYAWDDWTATPYNDGGYTVYELRNAYTGECMYDDEQIPAVEANCIPTDHFEWFYWPDVGLPNA